MCQDSKQFAEHYVTQTLAWSVTNNVFVAVRYGQYGLRLNGVKYVAFFLMGDIIWLPFTAGSVHNLRCFN